MNNSWLGKTAYAALFVVLLPAVLMLWAMRLDGLVPLPVYGSPLMGGVVVLLGAALVLGGTGALWHYGRGLPMSPYPPEHFVSRGVYRYLHHPLYVGAVLIAAGLSLALRSPAGLWIVTPTLAAAAAAWVLGFERAATCARYGEAMTSPRFSLAPDRDDSPSRWQRIALYPILFLPWVVLYEAVELLGVPHDAVSAWQGWDQALPVLPATELFYLLAYPVALAVPWLAQRQRDLRWFVIRGWTATALIIPLYLLLPLVATAKPVVGDGVLQTLMQWERVGDQPVTAFPAFHVVWTVLAAVILGRRWPRLIPLWWLMVAAVSVSCVTTGMHASMDVLAGLAISLVVILIDRVWQAVRGWAERVANSWREWDFGPVRLINHGLFAALGSWLGLLLMVTLAGPAHLWGLLGLAAASVAGAALWAQLMEGSPQLLRPYGYYGSVLGTMAGVAVAAALGADAWLLWAAFAIGGSLAQAIGRGRCLVQGCCHGSECPGWLGIRYQHPRSRVTRLSTLGGTPLHPTQLYSAGWMLLVTLLLLRLWLLGAGLQFIVGSYFLLTGLGRFVEEHYRGEPQTMVWAGFRLYQWLALTFLLVGGVITMLGWRPAPALSSPTGETIVAILAFGVVTYVAYGVDFPRLNIRFSRLV